MAAGEGRLRRVASHLLLQRRRVHTTAIIVLPASGCCDGCSAVSSQPASAASKMTARDKELYQRGVDMDDRGGFEASSSSPAEVAIFSHLAIPMRDGTRLYADLYRPAAAGRYPTLVNRTPYNHENMKTGQHMRFAQEGFAFLEVYVRGKVESEGTWEPFRNDGVDGYDVIEWAAAQEWSSGRVACQGGSYPGQNQWMTAVLQPPSLVCIKPNVASTSLYHNWVYHGGCFRLAFNFGWGCVRMPHRVMKAQNWHTAGPPELSYERLLQHKPLGTADVAAAHTVVQYYRDWLDHSVYDEYWRHVSVEERFEDVQVPVFTEGGWFDIFLGGTINGFVGTKKRHLSGGGGDTSRLTIGPWGHTPSDHFGDLDFGSTAMRDRDAADTAWFRHHLLGLPLSLPASHPVEIFCTFLMMEVSRVSARARNEFMICVLLW